MISFRYQIHLENVVPAKLHRHFYLLTYLLTYSLGGGLYWCLLCYVFRHNLPDRVSRGEEVRLGVSVVVFQC